MLDLILSNFTIFNLGVLSDSPHLLERLCQLYFGTVESSNHILKKFILNYIYIFLLFGILKILLEDTVSSKSRFMKFLKAHGTCTKYKSWIFGRCGCKKGRRKSQKRYETSGN